MSANGSSSGGSNSNNSNPSAKQRPIPERIDFVYDHATEGDVPANGEVRARDFTEVIGDFETDTNEVVEVWKVELIPPTNDDDSLQSVDSIRLWDGDSYYPNLRLREFQLGFFGPDFHLTSKPLGIPVLSGQVDPEQDPINSATPKFGPSTTVSPAVVNDGSAITSDFRVRLHTWKFKGSESEFSTYFQSQFGRTTFNQNIRMSNPFTSSSRQYNRGTPTRISQGAQGGALGQWTKLTGGIDQELPKVNPWATHATNNQATRANSPYQFTTANSRVGEQYQKLEFDLTDQRRAIFFETIEVNQVANMMEGSLVIEERDYDPTFQLGDNSAHELPILRPLDGTQRTAHDHDQLPRELSDVAGTKQVLWNDGGGFRVTDNGTSIDAEEILVGVQGKMLELTS